MRNTYTYLMNGTTSLGNWTGLFRSGEKVRLRFINGSAMTYFDVRIPGLKMTVVAADGQYVHPVTVDEFRIAVAETFDVIVEPSRPGRLHDLRPGHGPHGLRQRHAGGARRPARPGAAARSAPDPDHGRHGPWRHGGDGMANSPGHAMTRHDDHSGHAWQACHGSSSGMRSTPPAKTEIPWWTCRPCRRCPKLDDPGIGLRDNGRQVLTYADAAEPLRGPRWSRPGPRRSSCI